MQLVDLLQPYKQTSSTATHVRHMIEILDRVSVSTHWHGTESYLRVSFDPPSGGLELPDVI